MGLGIGVLIEQVYGASGSKKEGSCEVGLYKLLLWRVYDNYVVAMRDMETTVDLVKSNYYAQYLDYPYKGQWALEGFSPKFYADDAMEQMDYILKLLTKNEWPNEFKDEVSQLQTYVSELRQLVLRIQEIANKILTRNQMLILRKLY